MSGRRTATSIERNYLRPSISAPLFSSASSSNRSSPHDVIEGYESPSVRSPANSSSTTSLLYHLWGHDASRPRTRPGFPQRVSDDSVSSHQQGITIDTPFCRKMVTMSFALIVFASVVFVIIGTASLYRANDLGDDHLDNLNDPVLIIPQDKNQYPSADSYLGKLHGNNSTELEASLSGLDDARTAQTDVALKSFNSTGKNGLDSSGNITTASLPSFVVPSRRPTAASRRRQPLLEIIYRRLRTRSTPKYLPKRPVVFWVIENSRQAQ